MQPVSPRVFISYTHDNTDHCNLVLALAQQLRRDGVDAKLDQFCEDELLHWPTWCVDQMRPENADFVLCICTNEYCRRVEGKVDPDIGKGITLEFRSVANEIHNKKDNKRFIPVLLDKAGEADIPEMLNGYTWIRIESFGLNDAQSGYAKLYRLLTGQCGLGSVPLGQVMKLPSLPEIKQGTNFITPVKNYPIINSSQPRNTLPPRSYFVGRKKELENIADALSPNTRTWGALIDGPGGIGKTALAVEAGYLAPESEFTLKLFYTAKVRELTHEGIQPVIDTTLFGFMGLLRTLARELNEEGIERINEVERVGVIRTALSKHKILLIIDNVEELNKEEQKRIYQFLSKLPPPCKAIVTSRYRSNIDVRTIQLERLDENDALAFMEELARNNPYLRRSKNAERSKLYGQTAGNPLLIRWVVGQLGRPGSRCSTVEEACKFLHQIPKDHDALEYVFTDLMDSFSDTQAIVLAMLTHFDSPAKLQWLVELTGLNQTLVQTALQDLSDRILFNADIDAETYYLPCYAGTFLRHKNSNVVEEAESRLKKYVYGLAEIHGKRNHQNFNILEDKWNIIKASFPCFIKGNNAELQSLCKNLRKFLDFFGHWDESIALNQAAKIRALEARDFNEAGWRAYHIGWIHFQRRDPEQVIFYADCCLTYWGKHPDNYNEARGLRLKGLGYRLMQEHEKSLNTLRVALTRLGDDPVITRDIKLYAMILNSYAKTARFQNDFITAEANYNKALQFAESINNDIEGIAIYTGNLAELKLAQGKWKEAETLARKALESDDQIMRQELIGRHKAHLALSLAKQKRFDEGVILAQRAIEILTPLRVPDELAHAKEALRACDVDIKLPYT